jgi:hypothetical protein
MICNCVLGQCLEMSLAQKIPPEEFDTFDW